MVAMYNEKFNFCAVSLIAEDNHHVTTVDNCWNLKLTSYGEPFCSFLLIHLNTVAVIAVGHS